MRWGQGTSPRRIQDLPRKTDGNGNGNTVTGEGEWEGAGETESRIQRPSHV